MIFSWLVLQISAASKIVFFSIRKIYSIDESVLFSSSVKASFIKETRIGKVFKMFVISIATISALTSPIYALSQ